MRQQEAPAEADGRAPVVLAVAVVEGVLGGHQPGRDHQVVDGRRVRMAGDHVPAQGESVELVLPVRGEQLDLVHRPRLDPSADLLDPHGIGLRHRVVEETGDRNAHGGRFGRSERLLAAGRIQPRRAQTAGAAQDPPQGGSTGPRRGGAGPVIGYGHGDGGQGGGREQDGRRRERSRRRRGGRRRDGGSAAAEGLDAPAVTVGPEVDRGRGQARLPRGRPGVGHPRLLGSWVRVRAVPALGHGRRPSRACGRSARSPGHRARRAPGWPPSSRC